jgi:HlyD family secretion protein
VLISPIDGVVTKQEAKVGEIMAANTIVVSLISESQFKIESNVAEADIAKVKIGNLAIVTLDAYSNDVIFEAGVVAIDPAETMIEGVATYKTTLHFTHEDKRIKTGMTADIDIVTDQRENVIVVPIRAIITKNGDTIVQILKEKKPVETKVKTGLRGSDGNIEIIEGLSEGDKVVIPQQ